MRLLILDFLRRNKAMLLIVWGLVVVKVTAPPISLGLVPMGIWIGLLHGFSFESRVILQLPISRREIWRTRWILWNLFPVIALAGVRFLAMTAERVFARPADIHPSWILLLSAMELSFLGTVLIAAAFIQSIARKLVSPPVALLIKLIFYVAVVGLPAFVHPDLPTQWSQLTSPMILALAIGFALTLMSYFYSPEIAPRTIFRRQFGQSTRGSSAGLNVSASKEGPVGLNLFMRRQLHLVLWGAIPAGIASQVPLVIVELLKPNGRPALERMTVFFDPIPTGAIFSFFAPVLVNVILLIFSPDFLGLRHLRTLPLPRWVLSLILTLTPTLFWLIFWIFPVAGYWVFAKHLPSTLRLDILAGLTGLACLSGATGLSGIVNDPGRRVMLPFLSAPGFLLFLSYNLQLNSPIRLLIGILGLLSVVISFWLNCRGLERNSSAYVPLLRSAARPTGVVL